MLEDSRNYTVAWLKQDYRAHFESLYKQMYKRLYVFARNYLFDEYAAEDIVQEVFTMLWTKGHSLKEDVVLPTYLLASVKNLCLDYHRRLKIEDRYQKHMQETEACLYEMEEEDTSLLDRVREVTSKLSEMQQKVLELSVEKGLKYKDIAKMLNVSEETVHTHVKRAYNFIRKNLLCLFFW